MSVEFKTFNAANSFLNSEIIKSKGLECFIPGNNITCKGIIRYMDEDVTEKEIIDNTNTKLMNCKVKNYQPKWKYILYIRQSKSIACQLSNATNASSMVTPKNNAVANQYVRIVQKFMIQQSSAPIQPNAVTAKVENINLERVPKPKKPERYNYRTTDFPNINNNPSLQNRQIRLNEYNNNPNYVSYSQKTKQDNEMRKCRADSPPGYDIRAHNECLYSHPKSPGHDEFKDGTSSTCQKDFKISSMSTVSEDWIKKEDTDGVDMSIFPITIYPNTVFRASGSFELPEILPFKRIFEKTSAPSNKSILPGRSKLRSAK
ncbi:hypothetical protein JTB14_001396 [Gonioctena quinquepunctata]|nr:hypothetical protein JTB14_001396 [Gonioctena quinquepunctata]